MKQLLKIETIFLVILAFLLCGKSYGQGIDSTKCNISIVLDTDEQVDTISEKLMFRFLRTFGQECKNNAEFSEFSNETLFKVIQKQPKLFCETLEKYKNKIEVSVIILELENPLHDLINLKFTKERISQIKINSELKTQLLDAIDKAIKKS